MMEFDHYLMWFVDSLKASIDDDTVNEKKLNKNVESCFQRVKKACTGANKEQDFEDFRIRGVLLLLMCCPSIRHHKVVGASKDFQLVASTLPTLNESHFLSVVKNQRCYRCLTHILSYLPISWLSILIKEYFGSVDGVKPVTLAMSLELFNSYLLSWQSDMQSANHEGEILEHLNLFVKYLSSKTISSNTKVLIKSSAYYFMYLTKYLLSMLTVYVGNDIDYPEIPISIINWKNLWKKEVSPSSPRNSLFVKDVVTDLLKLCQQNNESLSVDLWMEWSEIVLPSSVIPHRSFAMQSKKIGEKSIQSVICNIAFDITNLFELHPSLHGSLKSVDYEEFLQFMKQVACDPDYDPDNDLPLDHLIQEIDLKDEREGKLLEILLNKEDIYMSQECLDCVKSHLSKVSIQSREDALLKFIAHVKNRSAFIAEWQEFILEITEDIPSRTLMPIIVEELDSGRNEILKTVNFGAHSTAVFNQLVGENAPEAQEKHVWLCLQSGKEVVQQAITLPISLPGLVPVMVRALSAIPEICQALLPSGISVVANALRQAQEAGLSGREKRDYADLVIGLMNAGTLPVKEVVHILIEPYLEMESKKSIDDLTLPLELLKNIVDRHLAIVSKPGIELNSLIISLMFLISNTVYLHGPQASTVLTLRLDAEYIISIIAKDLVKNMSLFEKDISFLKQVVKDKGLHPCSFLPLANVLECKQCEDSFLDRMLYLLNHMELKRLINNGDIDLEASHPEWVLALLQILPHSSDREWVSGMFLTHQFLQSEKTAYPTLQAMQELLQLVCTLYTGMNFNEDNNEETDISYIPSLSIQHCFKCFSSSAMVYVEDLLKIHPCSKRFQQLCHIFKWWCLFVPSFQCHPELPTLFLAKLCSSLEEMVSSGKLKVERSGTEAENRINEREEKGNSVERSLQTESENIEPHSQLPDANTAINQGDIADSHESKKQNEIEEKQKEEVFNSSFNSRSLSSTNYYLEIEELIASLVKYVPVSNVAATIGSKLKKLYEQEF